MELHPVQLVSTVFTPPPLEANETGPVEMEKLEPAGFLVAVP
jgi:hypothetical protein